MSHSESGKTIGKFCVLVFFTLYFLFFNHKVVGACSTHAIKKEREMFSVDQI
jgi:hypothetical protein